MNLAKKVIAACAVVVVAVLGLPAAAHAAGPIDGVYIFPARPEPLKCLDIPNGSTANYVKVIIYTCRYQPNARWTFEARGTGSWQIRNDLTNKCLAVFNASTDQNAPIVQFDCNGTSNSLWRTNYVRPVEGSTVLAWYELQNVNSGRCMAVKNADTANGTTLLQFTCNRGLNAQFTWNRPS